MFRTAGAIILMISHGYSVEENDDPFVNLVESAVHQFSECSEPGAFMVDVVPLRKPRPLHWSIAGDTNFISFLSCPTHIRNRYTILARLLALRVSLIGLGRTTHAARTVRYVPDWFPAAGWKAKAKLFARTLTEMANIPHQFVKDQVVS